MDNRGTDGGTHRGERGQSLQDYALGIGLFTLVSIGLLTATLPTVFAPFEDRVGGDRASQADRVAQQMVANMSVDESANKLNATTVAQVASYSQDELRQRYGLPNTTRVNFTIRSTGGTATFHGTTDGPVNRSTATSARVVTLDDGTCSTGCRLVVRTW